uniref:Uncharacterized protein n=1 Tax=Oryza brachyantha TaxID=4533 RepID=J3N601_ORYBR
MPPPPPGGLDTDAAGHEGLLPPDDDDLFVAAFLREGEEESKVYLGIGGRKKGEVVAWGIDKWRRAQYAKKAPRMVAAAGARVSPCPIQEPC